MVSLWVLKGKHYLGQVRVFLYLVIIHYKEKKRKGAGGGGKENLIFGKHHHVLPALIPSPFPLRAKRSLISSLAIGTRSLYIVYLQFIYTCVLMLVPIFLAYWPSGL